VILISDVSHSFKPPFADTGKTQWHRNDIVGKLLGRIPVETRGVEPLVDRPLVAGQLDVVKNPIENGIPQTPLARPLDG
jgi:hypothetical protein